MAAVGVGSVQAGVLRGRIFAVSVGSIAGNWSNALLPGLSVINVTGDKNM